MTAQEPAPIAGAATTDDGVQVVDLGFRTRDQHRRLPSVLALARHTGGLYAEQLAGMTVPRALQAAELDFTVAKHGPISVPVGDVQVQGLPKLMSTVAVWPEGSGKPASLLGVVGKNYPVAQPMQAAEFGQVLLDEGGATVAAVCAYGEPRGSKMVMAFKLPEGIKVGGEDPYDVYLFVGNSFNRETSLWGCVAPIRIECTNQAAATFGQYACRFLIPHRGDMEGKVADARKTLEITGTFTQEYAKAAEQMLGTPMAGAEVEEFLRELFPTPADIKTDRGEDAWDARRHQIGTVIRSGERNTVGRGTRYAAYNGVVEWVDHYAPATSPTRRAARLVDGGTAERVKVDAVRLLLADL